MIRNFDLGQEVWWFDQMAPGEISIRMGKIHGMKWSKAFIRRVKIFYVDNYEIELQYLYSSKKDALQSMIEHLRFELDAEIANIS